MAENLILGVVLVLCLAYVVYRVVRAFKRSSAQAPGCSTCGTCVAANACDDLSKPVKDTDTSSQSSP